MRAERVDRAEELGLAGQQDEAGERGEGEDADVGRAEVRVQAAQAVGHLAVDTHRVHQPRDAEMPAFVASDEDRRGQQTDIDLAASWNGPRSMC